MAYAYRNLSTEDMHGEKWMPVEGLEEYYMVSNFGRIKSLERYIESHFPGNTQGYLRP
jgi:hypothetical protein